MHSSDGIEISLHLSFEKVRVIFNCKNIMMLKFCPKLKDITSSVAKRVPLIMILWRLPCRYAGEMKGL